MPRIGIGTGIGISRVNSEFNYFVDSVGGNDDNPGTSALPWKTVAKVNASTFQSGDRIGFKKGGSWRETLTVPSSGTTFGAYGTGDKPIISGLDLLTDWTDEGSDVWSSSLASQPSLLMVDGAPARLSRFPYPSDNHSLIVTATSSTKKYVTGDLYAQGSNLVVNGGFDSDAGWTLLNSATISGGKLHCIGQGSANSTICRRTISPAPQAGDIYKVVFTISNFTSGNLYFIIGSQNGGSSLTNLTNGTYSVVFSLSAATSSNFSIANGATAFYGDLDDFKCYKLSAFADNYFVGSTVNISTSAWAIEQKVITASSGTNRTVSWATDLTGAIPTIESQFFYIENKKELIVDPLQWAYSGGKVYLKVESGHTPANYVVEASVRDYGVSATSKSNFTIQDLKITGTNKQAVYTYECTSDKVSGCAIDYVKDGILIFHGNGSEIKSNTVTNVTQGNAVKIDWNYSNPVVINGNTITDISSDLVSPKEGGGIDAYQHSSAAITISDNAITRVSNCGISLSGNGCVAVISGNTVTNAAYCTLDQAGIYTAGRESGTYNPLSVSLTRNNVINTLYYANMHYGYARDKECGFGIYVDDYATRVTVSYNRVYNSGAYGIMDHNNFGNFFYNNTVSKSGLCAFRISEQTADLMHDNLIKNNIFAVEFATIPVVKISRDSASSTVAGTFDNNLYFASNGAVLFGYSTDEGTNYTNRLFGAWKTFSSGDAASVEGDPLFTSSTDFHLQAGSPAINAGADVGLTSDYEGNPIVGLPDIGAYEKQ